MCSPNGADGTAAAAGPAETAEGDDDDEDSNPEGGSVDSSGSQ